MAKLLYQYQFPQDTTENDKTSISSHMYVEPIQVFSESTLLLVRKRAEWKANIKENVESQSSDVAVADIEIDQESNALVWSEMETE